MLLFRNSLINFFTSKKYYTSYYKRVINKYKYPESYLKLYHALHTVPEELETSVLIAFSETISFGASLNSIKSKLKGSYRVVKELNDVYVLFTELKTVGYKFIIELHFYKQKLVHFKYVFRNHTNKNELKYMLMKKYFNEEKIFFEVKDTCIKDVDGNYIFILDEVNLSINYMTYDYGFYNHIIEMKTQKEKQKTLKYNNAMDELYNRL
ncbi:hypothetical protein [Tenacibaculum jejuense]|uniref:Uncharacterized protein n=1 Tax=Tenacibaculum jejuense TaxID=584609 RepID=A0A238U6M1_9FLAO|nr:hypothetical protein [Tenacibaculum jejuense]SNR14849.1 protein of unknown function [Tenacibaculum jejuense]